MTTPAETSVKWSAQELDVLRTEEGLVFNPYNPLNRKIRQCDVEGILTRYGIPSTIHNMALYERAFVHRSYIRRPDFENEAQNIRIVPRPPDCLPLSTKSNERLEFLGDGVLECVTKYLLYRRFPKADEGFMTEKKIAIVKNEAIGKIALEMGLQRWLIISRHAEEKKTRTNLKKLGCLFESFVGALFLDFNKVEVRDDQNWFQQMFVTGPGFQMAQKFIENIFEQHIDWTLLIQNDDNYKNILQVKIQKEFKVTPFYLEIDVDFENGYRMGVYLSVNIAPHLLRHKDAIDVRDLPTFGEMQEYLQENGNIFVFLGEGTHKIKRKAEQLACLAAIGVLPNTT